MNKQQMDELLRLPTLAHDMRLENERLRKVVEAVKAYAPVEYQGRIYDTPSEWQAVLDALAAYEQTGEGE